MIWNLCLPTLSVPGPLIVSVIFSTFLPVLTEAAVIPADFTVRTLVFVLEDPDASVTVSVAV
ncbi:MAG: hypothetical protein ACRDRD_15205 [Pseudonocardiaceae bacterium]